MAYDGIALTSPYLPRISGNARRNLRTAWLFTVLWNVVSAPVLIFVPHELDRQPLAAVGFLFPLVGAGLLIWTVRATARSHRFGDTWLEASDAPRPGQAWSGAIHTQLPLPSGGDTYDVRLRLTCLNRTSSRSNGERSVQERILWREEHDVPAHRIAYTTSGASVPFRFTVPGDAQETTAVDGGDGVLWVVTAEASLPGVDLQDDFDVVVRRGAADSGGDTRVPRSTLSPAVVAPVTFEELAAAGIAVRAASGGLTFRFAPMRNVAMAAGTTAFTALWTGALWFQTAVGFPWIFPVVTGLFDLLLIAIVLELWLGTTTVVVADGTVSRRHGWLGFGATRAWTAAEIARIDVRIGMQTSGRYGTPYYEARATLENGRTVSLGDGIRNKRHAEWIVTELRARLG